MANFSADAALFLFAQIGVNFSETRTNRKADIYFCKRVAGGLNLSVGQTNFKSILEFCPAQRRREKLKIQVSARENYNLSFLGFYGAV